MKVPTPTRAYLEECFEYDRDMGTFIWRVRPASHFIRPSVSLMWNARMAGKNAGWMGNKGYYRVALDGKQYLVHRLVWKMITDEEPVEIDHKNRIRSDNKWDNLRRAAYNSGNVGMHADNGIGLKGVWFNRRTGKFGASVMFQGVRNWLGTFNTKEEAHTAYCEEAKRRFGDFWSDGKEAS